MPPAPDWFDDLEPLTSEDDPLAPPFEPGASAEPITDTPLDTTGTATALPAPGIAEVTLATRGLDQQTEGLPVAVAAGSRAARGLGVQVEVLDQALSQRAGVSGFAFRLSGAGGAALASAAADPLPATVTLDYSSFKDLYGGGYADRLQVVVLPECALADPIPADCDRSGNPLPSRNDRTTSTLEVDVSNLTEVQATPHVAATDAAAAAPAGPGVVLALMAGSEGPGGSFKATPFSASGDWQVGLASGEFSWSWQMPIPTAIAGAAPSVDASYSSGGVDAMVTSKNTQASSLGLGWGDFADAFVERRYNTCGDEGTGTADLCWATDNATISLNGQTSELVPVPNTNNTQWRLRSDARWRVERLTITNPNLANGDNDGEYWKVTTPDGTQYWFGLGRDPVAPHAETNSTWWVPVMGDDLGEPCYNSAGWFQSMCNQAWRWNLDWVVDPNGNAQLYRYETESQYYGALNGWPGLEMPYVMGGQIERVGYGRRDGVGTIPIAKAIFETGWRCSTLNEDGLAAASFSNNTCPEPGTPGVVFPDVPLDLRCVQGPGGSVPAGCTGNTSPTFWSAKRYIGASTWIRSGGAYMLVDTFKFTHTFQDPEAGTTDDSKLWLTGIQRTGHDHMTDESIVMPAVTFEPVSLQNRHNPGTESPMLHWRIGTVSNEFGGQTKVTYGQPHPCNPPLMPGDPSSFRWDSNTTDCFPQMWAPQGQPPTFRAFNKYLVTQVEEKDTTGGSVSMITKYLYGDQINTAAGAPQTWNASRDQAGAAWHHDDADPWVPMAKRSWSDWRGYQDILITQDSGRTRYKVHRGMDEDLLGQPNPGFRDIKISSLDGTVTNIDDSNWLRGRVLDEMMLRGDGSPETGTVHRYLAVMSADFPGTDPLLDAQWVGENDTVVRRRTPAAGTVFARKRTQTNYNGILLFPEAVIEHGWTDVSGDERCTVTNYVFNGTLWLIDYPFRVARYGNTTCDQAALSRTEVSYDNLAAGQAPVRGNQTTSRTQLTGTSWTTGTWATTTTTYDVLGRTLSVTDPNNHTTTTAYAPAAPGPDPDLPVEYPYGITVTNAAGHSVTTTFDQGISFERQVPGSTTDANGNVTTFTYDPLGRLTAARQPTEAGSGPASWTFGYDIDPDKSQVPVIHTAQLQDTNGPGGAARYLNTWTVYDSLLRERQTHTQSPNQTMTIVTDSTYDARGLVLEASQPQPVTGTPGQGILPMPAGGWANRTGTFYDHLGRPSWVIDAYDDADADTLANNIYRHQTPTYTYNSADTQWMKADNTKVGTRTLTVTDAYDRTTRVEEHDGTAWRPTVYTYDAADRLKTITDPANNKITYTYDLAGRRTVMDDPDAGHWEYAYDAVGNQLTVKDATNAITATVYDVLDRAKERRQASASGPLLASWAYDAPGELGLLNLSTRHTAGGNWVSDVTGYDDRNRPTGQSWTVPASVTGLAGTYDVGYGYDAADHQTSVSYPAVGGLAAETVTTSYDSIGLPIGVAGSQQYGYVVAYDERARPLWFGYGNSAAPTLGKIWNYDSNQRLASQTAATTAGTVQNRTITYDVVGNVTERNTNLNGGQFRECFGYDQRERLTSAYTTSAANTCPSGAGKGTGANPYNHQYTYTVDGNLKTRVEGGVTTTYSYPAGGPTSVRPHAPTAVGSNSYTWNANGSEATRSLGGQTQTFNWDSEHRLAGITSPTGNSSNVYTADGERLLRSTPQGKTLYIEGHEITAPTSGATTAVRSYGMAGQAVATRSTSGGVDFVVSDSQGSLELTVPYGGTTAETVRTYLPYGKVRTGAQPDSDYAWLGQVEDDHTGLQYLNARYYDPTIGVFTAPDPVADPAAPRSFNPYAYAHGNPASHADPSGAWIPVDNSSRPKPAPINPINHGAQRPNDSVVVSFGAQPGAEVPEDKLMAMWYFESGGGAVGEAAVFSKSTECQLEIEGCELRFVVLDGEDLLDGLLWWLTIQHSEDVAQARALGLLKTGGSLLCGFLPVCGEAQDGLSAFFNVLKGDWTAAGLDAAGLLAPFASRTGFRSVENLTDAWRAACSFDGRTQVVMGDGKQKAISEVEVGDLVLAADPETGESGPRRVIGVWAHPDEVLDLRVEGGGRVTTTADHPFWNDSDQEWQQAADLDSGELLFSADGDDVVVDALLPGTARSATAYNLTVEDLHTYLVGLGEEAVLVHNDGCGGIHGIFRGATRDVDIDEVVRTGDIFHQTEDGRFIFVRSNGNGTNSAVILEGVQASDELVTVLEDLSDTSLARKIDDGEWTPMGDL